MLFFLFLILLGLGTFIFIQYQKHRKANELYLEAKALEQKDTRTLYDLTNLKQALALYKQCKKLVNKQEYVQAVKQCQQKIDDFHEFQDLLANGIKKANQSYFKEALVKFIEAQKIFNTKELRAEISKCRDNIEQQESYEKAFKQSVRVARQGQFKEAIAILEPEIAKFSRDDGSKLLAKLQRICTAKECYRIGLLAERNGMIENAIKQYKEALQILPELTECQIRLAILSIETNHPTQAISYLQGINNTQSSYLRGFAHTQLGNWQEANREWRSISRASVDIQRSILKKVIDRDRLLTLREIEKHIDKGLFLLAQSASLKFIEKFGSDLIVQANLEEHIRPNLERKIWNDRDWKIIAIKTEQIWLKEQDINSLHNWAVANYYLSQTDLNKLANFIIAWSTALANIEYNPKIKNIPWLGTNSIDIKDVFTKLKQILENAIDAVKDDDIEEYLKLRDIYRRDMVSLYYGENSSIPIGVRVNRIFIPSGCYQRYRHKLTGITFPAEKLYSKSIQAALYTDWGLAVAACLEGDTTRAIKIKPYKNPYSEADNFACCFVSYHEGCYYLQNLEWRKAIKPFHQAKPEIKAKSAWCKEIDRLCEAQRQKINDFDEHLQFSKFWCELIDSQPSKSYFAEQSAIQVGLKIDDKKISLQQGLDELRKIRNNIDRNNATTLDLIEKVEYSLAAEKIDRLLKDNQYEEAIRVAKQSQNEAIRFKLAEIFIDVLLSGSENRSLDFDGMYQLAKWAYQLCPHEPVFMPIYRELGIY